MAEREQTYRVLIVSASEAFAKELSGLLPLPTFSPIKTVPAISLAKRELSERDFDFVIINSPLRDDPGTHFAIDAADASGAVVLFLTRAEQYDEAYGTLSGNGVFLLQKPISRSLFSVAADWLVSAREGLRKTQKKTMSIEEKVNEIRLVNRAKWLLISELKMTESDAHRYIEKQAMDRCVPKKQVAEEIIKLYS
ncbi:MAG: ANTAR domain-containing protein [Clostridia bacterium]|nr:ANTAR domain-containing protein [Clostridia bacterium]